MMKSAKLPQTVKTLSDGKWASTDTPKLNNTLLIHDLCNGIYFIGSFPVLTGVQIVQ